MQCLWRRSVAVTGQCFRDSKSLHDIAVFCHSLPYLDDYLVVESVALLGHKPILGLIPYS